MWAGVGLTPPSLCSQLVVSVISCLSARVSPLLTPSSYSLLSPSILGDLLKE